MREISFIQAELERTAAYVRGEYADRSGLLISAKRDLNDVLTAVDSEVQRRIVARLHESYPGDAIVGEESGFDAMPNDPRGRIWIIDPIDGTQNFVRGLFPVFGSTIAFMEDGLLQAGGIVLPMQGDLFLAERGQGATRNGQPIRVSPSDTLMASRLELDVSHQGHRAAVVQRFGGLIEAFGQVRVAGAATVGLAAVACGEADAYLHVGLKLWDHAAGVLMIEEAGGTVTRLDGSPLALDTLQTEIAASNGAIHAALVHGIL